MKWIIPLALALGLAVAQPELGERERVDELTRRADTHMAKYELDQVERLLDEALGIALRSGESYEFSVRWRLAILYGELQKRDGRDWRSLAIPHLRRAIDLSKYGTVVGSNQLSIRLAMAIIELSAGRMQIALSPELERLLDRFITQLELKEGPLSPVTALSYEALTFAASNSEGSQRALYACDLLVGMNHAPAEFSATLIHCAEHELHTRSIESTRQLIRLARATATAGGPRYNYEKVVSYVLEAELAASLGGTLAGLSALDSASELATKSLSLTHEVWETIVSVREILNSTNSKRELVRRTPLPVSNRLQPPKVLQLADPVYGKEAKAEKYEGRTTIAVLISPDGHGKVINTYRSLPYGLGASVNKAIEESKFQPWRKDGKPVAGVAVLELIVRPKGATVW